ncbi:MAG: SDR family NAD(P)-dependent oxidoreductase [Clostridia bacterium]|nr:SDR family NAD(P)-dependent oxidoreductase [Clostridia bacterium]
MKNVLITGGAGGMGRAVAELLSKKGFRVFALDLKACEEKENIIPVRADLTKENEVRMAFNFVKGQTDSLYAILHFVGTYNLDSLLEIDERDFDRIFAVNVKTAYLINKVFLPLLEKGSRIIITTSELAPLDPLPFTGIYAVTKAALDKYAYSLRMEMQLLGISVSTLRAGAVKTDMLGVSTDALDRFCEKTELYSCNARRFKSIVNRVEARSISSEKLAKKVAKMLEKRKLKFAYSINRNPLLLILHVLPKSIQLWAIRQVLR